MPSYTSPQASVQGDGIDDLSDDEIELVTTQPATASTSLVKRPFIVLQKGDTAVQLCERMFQGTPPMNTGYGLSKTVWL